MIIAKSLFILFILFIGLYFLKNSGAKVSALKRIFAISIVLIGIWFILFPNTSDTVARMIGISRGADLVFYMGLFLAVYSTISEYLFKKMYRAERSRIVRKISLLDKEIEELKKEAKEQQK